MNKLPIEKQKMVLSAVGTTASKLLRNPKTPKGVKSVAGSALTQRPDKKKGKK